MTIIILSAMFLCLSNTPRLRPVVHHVVVRNLHPYEQHSYDLITSTRSEIVKKIVRFQKNSPKKRQELQQVVVEGPRMIFDILNSQKHIRVHHILIDHLMWEDKYAPQLIPLLIQNKQATTSSSSSAIPPHILLATPQVIRACTDIVTSQGMVAIVDRPQYTPKPPQQQQQLYLILDGIQDPGNVGALFRSAVAAGVVAGVMCLEGTCDPWNPKAVRSAMGTTFWLPPMQGDDDDSNNNSWEDACAQLAPNRIYAATMLPKKKEEDSASSRPRNTCYYDVNWTAGASNETVALVIGSEGFGLSPAVRKAVERGFVSLNRGYFDTIPVRAIHVPMEEAVESLNAAVCGSVILFEYQRQLRQRQLRQRQQQRKEKSL